MVTFDVKKWCSDHRLKEQTIEELKKNDLDCQEALRLVHADDLGTMDLTLRQKKLLLHALQDLNGAGQEAIEEKPAETAPVTTKL